MKNQNTARVIGLPLPRKLKIVVGEPVLESALVGATHFDYIHPDITSQRFRIVATDDPHTRLEPVCLGEPASTPEVVSYLTKARLVPTHIGHLIRYTRDNGFPKDGPLVALDARWYDPFKKAEWVVCASAVDGYRMLNLARADMSWFGNVQFLARPDPDAR
jgi:hypothetical protein